MVKLTLFFLTLTSAIVLVSGLPVPTEPIKSGNSLTQTTASAPPIVQKLTAPVPIPAISSLQGSNAPIVEDNPTSQVTDGQPAGTTPGGATPGAGATSDAAKAAADAQDLANAKAFFEAIGVTFPDDSAAADKAAADAGATPTGATPDAAQAAADKAAADKAAADKAAADAGATPTGATPDAAQAAADKAAADKAAADKAAADKAAADKAAADKAAADKANAPPV
ncbi:hypothetical protein BGZ83_009897 [Gryganskiella cystojenkinii]|nr:hypothetical protein BGZ83_009897 [Gryganskiella cystojenkinii]